MRQTNHQRKIDAAEVALELYIQGIVQEELNRLWRGIALKIRRINAFRPKGKLRRPRLEKADVASNDLWELFVRRMRARLLEALTGGAISIEGLLSMRIVGTPLEYDSDALAREVEAQIGDRITRVASSIKREVGHRIVAWYNSPGLPMRTIINQLRPAFGITRAELIARNEVTSLDSAVQSQIAARLGISEWWWMTKRDQIVCKKKITGPDGNKYNGCRELHGRTFKVGDPMPPHGSHIGCRCKAILIVVKPAKVIERPIVDISHLIEKLMAIPDDQLPSLSKTLQAYDVLKAEFIEEQHPRDNKGEFAPKGGGGGGGVAAEAPDIEDHPELEAFKLRHYTKASRELADLISTNYDKFKWDADFTTLHDSARIRPTGDTYRALISEAIKGAKDPDTKKLVINLQTRYRIAERRFRSTLKPIDPVLSVGEWKKVKTGLTMDLADGRVARIMKSRFGGDFWIIGVPDTDGVLKWDTIGKSEDEAKAEGKKYIADKLKIKVIPPTPPPAPAVKPPKAKKPGKVPEPDPVVIDWKEEASAGVSAILDDRAADVVEAGPDRWTSITSVKGSGEETLRTFATREEAIEDAEVYLANGRPRASRVKQPKVITEVTRKIMTAAEPLYYPDKANVNKYKKKFDEKLAELAAYKHVTVDEARAKCLAELKRVVLDEPVRMRIHPGDFEKILNDPDGEERYKSQFETKKSHGWIGHGGDPHDLRRGAERKGLGIPSGAEDRLRPVYGYINEKLSSPSNYGYISVKFNDAVKKRTTFTLGDSLGMMEDGQVATPMIDLDPVQAMWSSAHYFYDGVPTRGGIRGGGPWSYIEAQITGGVHMGEVEEVTFHAECFRGDSLTPQNKDLEKLFIARGWKVNYDRLKE